MSDSYEVIMRVPFSSLQGHIIESVNRGEDDYGDDFIEFFCIGGFHFKMHHEQDCCESVFIESITGDIHDLVGQRIDVAEVVTNESENEVESSTWTFYKIRTLTEDITIRWCGTSNGYYSEKVHFIEYPSLLSTL